jgi:hypothetical protein
MPTRAYYLHKARGLFELAASMSLRADAERLITRANEYQVLAEAMPPDDESPISTTSAAPATAIAIAQQDEK